MNYWKILYITAATRPKRPVKPSAYRTIPKPRPLEASSKRRIKQDASRDPVGVFIPYGRGDRERETGAQRTYNVRSSCDVSTWIQEKYLRALNTLSIQFI